MCKWQFQTLEHIDAILFIHIADLWQCCETYSHKPYHYSDSSLHSPGTWFAILEVHIKLKNGYKKWLNYYNKG